MSSLSDWSVYFWIVLGILVSVIMPVVRKPADLPHTRGETFGRYMKHVWLEAGILVRPYLFLAIFSLLAIRASIA